MFIKTEQVIDWRDLQEKVCGLFVEMGYGGETGKIVELAGRGKKEIDVFVTDPLASYNRTYLIECKHWDVNVPQEVIHSFKTVMEGAGANTGFIVSKRGFQSGSHEAARFTNIKLLTFEELQHLYGEEWFRKQAARLEIQENRLRTIRSLHFAQGNQLGIHNNVFFYSPELADRLLHFNHWTSKFLLSIGGRSPSSYLGPEPVQIPTNPIEPLSQSEDWFEFPTVRDYFEVMTRTAKQCADEFEELLAQATASFENLSDQEQSGYFQKARSRFLQETPISVLKQVLSQEEYQKLIERLELKLGPSGGR